MCIIKVGNEGAEMTRCGRLVTHTRTATGKVRSPVVDSRVRGRARVTIACVLQMPKSREDFTNQNSATVDESFIAAFAFGM